MFFRKSKPDFPFEEIAKKIAGKGNYAYKEDALRDQFRFNYRMSVSVSACPVSAAIISALGLQESEGWEEELCSVYTKADGKSRDRILNDIWHALFFYDDGKKLSTWLSTALQIDGIRCSQLESHQQDPALASSGTHLQ